MKSLKQKENNIGKPTIDEFNGRHFLKSTEVTGSHGVFSFNIQNTFK